MYFRPSSCVTVWFPAWVPPLVLATVSYIVARPLIRVRNRRRRGLCVTCGYDLRGNVSGVCPECGQAV